MNPYSINPPLSEVVFEELCLEILKKHWSRPGLERFGKKGENQWIASRNNLVFRVLREAVRIFL
jgi:hypothetical protein